MSIIGSYAIPAFPCNSSTPFDHCSVYCFSRITITASVFPDIIVSRTESDLLPPDGCGICDTLLFKQIPNANEYQNIIKRNKQTDTKRIMMVGSILTFIEEIANDEKKGPGGRLVGPPVPGAAGGLEPTDNIVCSGAMLKDDTIQTPIITMDSFSITNIIQIVTVIVEQTATQKKPIQTTANIEDSGSSESSSNTVLIAVGTVIGILFFFGMFFALRSIRRAKKAEDLKIKSQLNFNSALLTSNKTAKISPLPQSTTQPFVAPVGYESQNVYIEKARYKAITSITPNLIDELEFGIDDVIELEGSAYSDGWANGKNLRTGESGLVAIVCLTPQVH